MKTWNSGFKAVVVLSLTIFGLGAAFATPAATWPAYPAIGFEAPDYTAGPLAGQPIPNQQDRTAQVVGQMAQEVHQPSCGDVGVGAQGKVQSNAPAPGRDRQPRDPGDFFAGTSPLIQHGRPSPGRPTAPDQRRQQQAAFVPKDPRGVQALGVFFTCGQTVRTQRRMAGSSRSRALRAGFCGLQPKAWNRRPR